MDLGGYYYSESELKAAGFRKLGKNVKIHSRASIYCPHNISLGDHARIDDFTVLIATGEVNIGAYVHIATHVFMGGTYGLTLGDFAGLASGVKIFTSTDDYSGEYMVGPAVPRKFIGGKTGKIIINKHVIIGANSVVLPNCEIGEGSSIGALSLINKSLESWSIYGGIPVRKIKPRNKNILNLENQLNQLNRLD